MTIGFPGRTASWQLYDFSNSAYVLSGMTLFLPLYFSTHIPAADSASQQWGLLISLSLFIVAMLAPFVGALADRGKFRFKLFLLFNLMFVAALLTMALAHSVSPIRFQVSLVVATASFGLCLFLYDSLISGFFDKTSSTRESGKGWALGYIGGFLCLLLVYGALGFNMPTALSDYRLTFFVIVVFFVLFSLPLIVQLSQEVVSEHSEVGLIVEVRQTFMDIVQDKQLLLYLICALALMDGLTTLTFFISIYAKSVLEFNINQIATLLVIVQLVAIPSTVVITRLANEIGESRVLLWLALLWIVVAVLIYFSRSLYAFYAVALLAGTLLGSTPAVLRGWYARIIPKDSRSRYFGFNALASRVASVLGPLCYIVLASSYGEQIAILSVIPFFLLAAICLLLLQNKESRELVNSHEFK